MHQGKSFEAARIEINYFSEQNINLVWCKLLIQNSTDVRNFPGWIFKGYNMFCIKSELASTTHSFHTLPLVRYPIKSWLKRPWTSVEGRITIKLPTINTGLIKIMPTQEMRMRFLLHIPHLKQYFFPYIFCAFD